MSELSSVRPGTARSGRRRRSRLRRFFRGLALLAAVLLLLPVGLLPLYRVVDAPFGTVMLWKALAGAPIDKHWTPIDRIAPHLVRAVLSSEDQRFCAHGGIDFVELQKALDTEERPTRGASTITMQTVKNLFLWTGRDYLRKALEAPLALYADFVLPKRRIMEIYLNIAEWGFGTYGAEAASRRYFGIAAADLSARQAALLAAALPNPRARDPGNPGASLNRIARRIAARAEKSGAYVGCVLG